MSNLELAAMIVINLKNMAKMTPAVLAHPMYVLALNQAETLEKQLMEE